MNKLQIVEDIFGTMCFTPYLKIRGNDEYLYAVSKLHFFNSWSPSSVLWWTICAKRYGYELGVDFDKKAFELKPIPNYDTTKN